MPEDMKLQELAVLGFNRRARSAVLGLVLPSTVTVVSEGVSAAGGGVAVCAETDAGRMKAAVIMNARATNAPVAAVDFNDMTVPLNVFPVGSLNAVPVYCGT
jgi:hypothetical protein